MMTDEQTPHIPSGNEPLPEPADTTADAEPLAPSLADADALTDVAQTPAAEAVAVPDEQEEPFGYGYGRGDYDLMQGDLDIDAALAAVATLSDGAAEREASEDAQEVAAEPGSTPVFLLPTPTPVALKRGTPASFIPALILIVSGALLTLATTSGAAIPTTVVVFGALAALALLMLGYWLTARRWARGAFFFAVLLLLSAAAMYAITQPGGLGMAGLPLLIIATGAALVLTAFFSRPAIRRLALPGFLLIIGGAAALIFSLGLINGALLATITPYAWIMPIVLLVLWLLPLIFRRRSG
ncbi:MAG: hypothetical protein SF123_22150 [Chloroflexota bacterium]|nr:hypothetical protein [Chloroflexota bacterium]